MAKLVNNFRKLVCYYDCCLSCYKRGHRREKKYIKKTIHRSIRRKNKEVCNATIQ